MDPQTLSQILLSTMSPDNSLRSQAESALAQLEGTEGYFACLLQLVTLDLQLEIKQAACLRLKNTLQTRWSIKANSSDNLVIHATDRQIIKSNIVQAVVYQPSPNLRIQLLECFSAILQTDFPDEWPELLPSLQQGLNQSTDLNLLYASLMLLFRVFKKYRFKTAEARKPLNGIIDLFFPFLKKLFISLNQSDSEESFEMRRFIVKIFFVSIQMSLPNYFRQHSQEMKEWLSLILGILTIRKPQNSVAWKVKKWCALICCRIFARFGRSNKVEKSLKPFAKWFQTNMNLQILEVFMNILRMRHVEHDYVSDRVTQLAWNYFDSAMEIPASRNALINNREFLVCQCLLSQLCMTQSDLECSINDPHEFIRRQLDVMEEFQDPRLSAINFFLSLIKYDASLDKADTLRMSTALMLKIFEEYANSSPDQKNYILKDGAMRLLNTLKKPLLTTPESQQSTERVFVSHIVPELTSQQSFLRARACQLLGTYSKMRWQDTNAHLLVIQNLCSCLKDSALVVRLEACSAVSEIIRHEQVASLLKGHLPVILEQYFLLMDEIGSEEIVSRLSDLCQRYGVEVAPFAGQIVQRLSGMFEELSKADSSDDESAMTALQCVRGINTILYAVDSLPDIIPQLELLVRPLISSSFTEDAIEFFEDILEMIGVLVYLTSSSKQGISDFLWSCLPKMVEAYKTWASDFFQNILMPIDNFISKGTDTFIDPTKPYLQIVLSLAIEPLSKIDKNVSVTVACYACKLLEAILANCKGKVDQIMPDTTKMCTSLLIQLQQQRNQFLKQRESEKAKKGKKAKKKKKQYLDEGDDDDEDERDSTISLRLLLCDVIGCSAYYNPSLFIKTVCSMGDEFVKTLFNYWLSHIQHVNDNMKHEKMAVIGLSSLLIIDPKDVNSILVDAFPHILNILIETLQTLHEQYKEEEENEEDDEYGSDDEEYDERVFLEEVNEEDIVRDQHQQQDSDNDPDDEEKIFQNRITDMMFEWEQNEVTETRFDSPLDDIDEFIYFSSVIHHFTQTQPDFFNQYVKHLQSSNKQLEVQFQQHLKEAAERQQKQNEQQKENVKANSD